MDSGMLRRLRNFTRTSPLKRKVLSLMAWSLSAEDCTQLQKHFLALDQEKSGTISLQQFKSALESEFESEQEAELIFNCLDTHGSTRITYSEFLAAVMPETTKLREDVLR